MKLWSKIIAGFFGIVFVLSIILNLILLARPPAIKEIQKQLSENGEYTLVRYKAEDTQNPVKLCVIGAYTLISNTIDNLDVEKEAYKTFNDDSAWGVIIEYPDKFIIYDLAYLGRPSNIAEYSGQCFANVPHTEIKLYQPEKNEDLKILFVDNSLEYDHRWLTQPVIIPKL